MQPRNAHTLVWNRHSLEMGSRTLIMGILNVTPDSFSDGGKYYNLDAAAAQGLKLAQDGADILDIGGESTRPFSESVSIQEEIRRVVPVIDKLAQKISIPISIDTNKAAVAKEAISAGASMINDISALRFDPEMAPLAAAAEVPVILMHMLGTPKTMQSEPVYDNVVAEVKDFLADATLKATTHGIPRQRIIIDPGIGFGKTIVHNLKIIHALASLQSLELPILVGPSRKSFIQNILKSKFDKETHADNPEIETGTQAAVSAAILNGAHIVRVHDVYSTVATTAILDAICRA